MKIKDRKPDHALATIWRILIDLLCLSAFEAFEQNRIQKGDGATNSLPLVELVLS